MKLLNLKEKNIEKSKINNEKILLIERLNKEETLSIRRLNKVLQDEKIEKNRIFEESQKDVPQLETKKSLLVDEVKFLEERKRISLIPVNKLKKEVENLLEENIKHRDILLSKTKGVENIKSDFLQKTENLLDMESEVEIKKDELEKREKNVLLSEEELKKSTGSLSNRWIELYNKIDIFNNEVTIREKEVEDVKKSNIVFKQNLDEVSNQQKEERRSIDDAYQSLIRAKNEIIGN